MRISIIIAAAAVCIAAPAVADDNSGTENPDDKVVCRRSENAATGSHLRRSPRVCQTRAEWREHDQALEQEMRAMRERARLSEGEMRGAAGAGSPQ